MNIVTKAKTYAIACHTETNHLYDDKPYETHLQIVVQTAEQFIHLISTEEQQIVLAACWVHDCIEDCRQTYHDVKQATNERVAELAYALTNEKGRNRKERANDKYYQGICATPNAVFVKLCDRIANVKYSAEQNHRMIEVYRKENTDFESKIYDKKYEEMFDHLRELLKNEILI